MATNINNGMCRCCASEGTYKHLSSEYQWMGETEVYADMLRDCFDINISMNEDGNDGGICEVCITQLRNAANFKKQVLHTEERFKNRLASGLLKNSIIKVEVNALEYDNNSEDNNLSEDFSTSEYMVPIKSESDEGKSKKRTRATTSRAKKPKVEEAESSTKRSTLWAASLSCDSCGSECASACGTRHFRSCCFNYLRKKRGPEAVKFWTPNLQDLKESQQERLPMYVVKNIPEPWFSSIASNDYRPYPYEDTFDNHNMQVYDA